MNRWNSRAGKLGLVVLASALMGCASSPRGPARATPGPGEAQVFVVNQVPAPLRLRRVQVTIDGAALGCMSGDDIGGGHDELMHLADTKLAPGPHRVAVHASAVDAASEHVIVLEVTKQLHASHAPIRLVVRISAPRQSAGLALDFAVQGATVDEPSASPQAQARTCAGLAPVAKALCDTQAMLEQALAQHDATRVVCVDDALRRMRALVQRQRLGFPATEGEAGELELRVLMLGEQAARCPSVQITMKPTAD